MISSCRLISLIETITHHLSYQGFWMQRVAALERDLAEERQRCRAAEKRAELLGGDVAEAPPQSPRPGEGEETALREREKELLKFEVRILYR